jgi:hypothetical protein
VRNLLTPEQKKQRQLEKRKNQLRWVFLAFSYRYLFFSLIDSFFQGSVWSIDSKTNPPL